MSRDLYLHSRNGWWSYRRKYPKAVKEFLSKELFVRAMSTMDKASARKKRPYFDIEFDNEVDRITRLMKPDVQQQELSLAEITSLAVGWFKDLIEQAQIDQANGTPEADLQDNLENLDWLEVGAMDGLARSDKESASIRADILLKEAGISVPKETTSYNQLCNLILRATAEFGRMQKKRLVGDYSYSPQDPSFKNYQASSRFQPSPNSKTLGDLIDDYTSEMKPTWTSKKTAVKYEMFFRVIRETIGANVTLDKVDRTLCRQTSEIIKLLPKNYIKIKEFKEKTPKQVVELNKVIGRETLSTGSVNDYIGRMASLFEWAVREEYMDRNPALKLQIKDNIKSKNKRNPFTIKELNLMFNTPLYTGCLNDELGYSKVGPNIIRRGRFWVPLLSLWTGMRLNECCQLHTADIESIDGVDVILVQEGIEGAGGSNNKRVKTNAGVRIIPIHPELKKMGFMDLVSRQVKAGEVRLFSELTLAKTGYYSDNFSSWFANYLRKYNVKQKKNGFHSFRHNYRDALREADISRERAKALGGWAKGDDTSDDYGGGLKANTLYEDIKKVSYDGLDLSHLHYV